MWICEQGSYAIPAYYKPQITHVWRISRVILVRVRLRLYFKRAEVIRSLEELSRMFLFELRKKARQRLQSGHGLSGIGKRMSHREEMTN